MTLHLLLSLLFLRQTPQPQRYPCLPDSLTPSSVVIRRWVRGHHPPMVAVTVKDTLAKLRARCSQGRLLDAGGRELRFYHADCFGAPTPYALETARRQRRELDSLRKTYTVIVTSYQEQCA